MDERSRHFAQGRQSAPPGVMLKKRAGHARVHGGDFLIGHWSVSAGGWQHSSQPRVEVVVDNLRQPSRRRVKPREIRRYRENIFTVFERIESVVEQLTN